MTVIVPIVGHIHRFQILRCFIILSATHRASNREVLAVSGPNKIHCT